MIIYSSALMKPIQRVVTCFILTKTSNHNPQMAIFHRCSTMPTFPNHWAAISGSIEPNETPYQAVQRELQEETNIYELSQTKEVQIDKNGPGLFIDVIYCSPRTQQERIIRVYPFVVYWGDKDDRTCKLEMKGTEHDTYQFVTIDELVAMEQDPNQFLVPYLVQTFHHATFGKYQSTIPKLVRQWANDKENGASVMASNALKIVQDDEIENVIERAKQVAMLRPTMVPIVNVMNEIIQTENKEAVTTKSFQQELHRCIDLGVKHIQLFLDESTKSALTILTFSRSGTIVQILQHILQQQTDESKPKIDIICSQSTPGNEGELMAKDLNCRWYPDFQIQQMMTEENKFDLLLIGSDCILYGDGDGDGSSNDDGDNDDNHKVMINKVGTNKLCAIANEKNIPVYCCADRWKLWKDVFPPSIENDLFEIVPLKVITKLLVPGPAGK